MLPTHDFPRHHAYACSRSLGLSIQCYTTPKTEIRFFLGERDDSGAIVGDCSVCRQHSLLINNVASKSIADEQQNSVRDCDQLAEKAALLECVAENGERLLILD